jgi:putative RNA 2'-phosphotransferase
MNKELVNISKEISYALRHNPYLYDLDMDDNGNVPIEQLISGINRNGEQNREISLEDIRTIMECSDKKRWEICDNKIRALYGHSISIDKMIGNPPNVLYHGTSHKSVTSIMEQGLLPMERHYVHLSTDKETAIIVGKRRDTNPVILSVDTLEAMRDCIHFYIGNDTVWLSDVIPPKYLSICNYILV